MRQQSPRGNNNNNAPTSPRGSNSSVAGRGLQASMEFSSKTMLAPRQVAVFFLFFLHGLITASPAGPADQGSAGKTHRGAWMWKTLTSGRGRPTLG